MDGKFNVDITFISNSSKILYCYYTLHYMFCESARTGSKLINNNCTAGHFSFIFFKNV